MGKQGNLMVASRDTNVSDNSVLPEVPYTVDIWSQDDNENPYLDLKVVEGWSVFSHWDAERENVFRTPIIEIRKIPARRYSAVLKMGEAKLTKYNEPIETTLAEKEIIEHKTERIVLKEPAKYYWVRQEHFDRSGGFFIRPLLGWRERGYKHVLDWDMFHKSLDEAIEKLGITKDEVYEAVISKYGLRLSQRLPQTKADDERVKNAKANRSGQKG